MSYRGVTELGDITPHNIKQLKKLNAVVFPITYTDKVWGTIVQRCSIHTLLNSIQFYKDVLDLGELAKLGILAMPLCLEL